MLRKFVGTVSGPLGVVALALLLAHPVPASAAPDGGGKVKAKRNRLGFSLDGVAPGQGPGNLLGMLLNQPGGGAQAPQGGAQFLQVGNQPQESLGGLDGMLGLLDRILHLIRDAERHDHSMHRLAHEIKDLARDLWHHRHSFSLERALRDLVRDLQHQHRFWRLEHALRKLERDLKHDKHHSWLDRLMKELVRDILRSEHDRHHARRSERHFLRELAHLLAWIAHHDSDKKHTHPTGKGKAHTATKTAKSKTAEHRGKLVSKGPEKPNLWKALQQAGLGKPGQTKGSTSTVIVRNASNGGKTGPAKTAKPAPAKPVAKPATKSAGHKK